MFTPSEKSIMKYAVLALLLVTIGACNAISKKDTKGASGQSEAVVYSIEPVWESDTLLRTPESVLIDRERDILYVSNVNLNPWEKDGNGFISKMDRSGNILELKWIEGLHGPKGMGISGGFLYIADIDALVEAEVETGRIIRRIELPGKTDLNDVAVSSDGTVYVSGSASNTIYTLKDGALAEFFKGGEERFNGIYRENDRMLLITSGSSQFKEINPETGEVRVIAEGMGHGDAIAPVGDGGYLCTSWAGKIFYVSAEGVVTVLSDTEAAGENAADLDFCIDQQILYVPTFFKNQVKAFRLVQKAV